MVRLLTTTQALDQRAELHSQICSRIGGSAHLSPAEQLEIYRVQFWLRHTASLVEDFPGLGGILGQADWERLLETYLSEHPPTSWTLRDLGAQLPAHVETCSWLPHRGLCADMARLEWAYIEVFDARDAAPLDAERIAAIPEHAWPTARIVLNPALRLLRVAYPVADLRRQLRQHPVASVLIPDAEPQCLVIYRGPDRNLKHASVPRSAFELLGLLHAGLPLAAACETVVNEHPELASDVEHSVQAWFADFAQRGWIVDVEPPAHQREH
jgi:hypothetical protein